VGREGDSRITGSHTHTHGLRRAEEVSFRLCLTCAEGGARTAASELERVSLETAKTRHVRRARARMRTRVSCHARHMFPHGRRGGLWSRTVRLGRSRVRVVYGMCVHLFTHLDLRFAYGIYSI
jgi:hypothetical protein